MRRARPASAVDGLRRGERSRPTKSVISALTATERLLLMAARLLVSPGL
jgi:hypothetical protein